MSSQIIKIVGENSEVLSQVSDILDKERIGYCECDVISNSLLIPHIHHQSDLVELSSIIRSEIDYIGKDEEGITIYKLRA